MAILEIELVEIVIVSFGLYVILQVSICVRQMQHARAFKGSLRNM